MKRFLLLGACVLSAASLSTLAVRGRCGIPPAPQPAVQPGAAGDPVADLVAVLSETKAKETYLAAVLTLGRMGPRAQPAVGAILRNGERLGVFTGVFDNGGATGAQAHIALEALAQIVQAQPGWGPPPPPPGPPQPPFPQPMPHVPQPPVVSPGAPPSVPPPPAVAPAVPAPSAPAINQALQPRSARDLLPAR